MIRALSIVAIAGFLMSLVCISAAVALGGPEVLARRTWSWTFERGWDWDERPGVWRHMSRDAGPEATRDFPFSGDRLAVDAPAEIDYVQSAGPARLTIRGSKSTLDRVRVENGRISLAPGSFRASGLRISLSAPGVKRFDLSGADRLTIKDYKQDELTLDASGHAQIRAEGETRTVKLSVSGHGDADLGGLKAEGAEIEISGAGQASARPTEWARIDISGVGQVDLLTRPKRLETDIAGAGQVRQPDANEVEDDEEDGRGPARPA